MRSRHSVIVSRLMMRAQMRLEALGSPLIAVTAPTITLPPHNAPEPDIVIARIDGSDFYVEGSDVTLVIEVSFSTLRYDLTAKRDLYARGGVPELWVVDGEGGIVHQFWSPEDGTYRRTTTVPLSGELQSAGLPDLRIDGSGI